MKPDRKRWQNLARDWDAYGHSIKWEDLFDIKSGSHNYVALAWMEHGEVNYADLASGDGGRTWEMQNDGHEAVSLKDWRRMRVKPDCDWLVLDGEMM